MEEKKLSLEKFLLLRAGDREDGKIKDSPLSKIGRIQIAETYKKISHYITLNDIVDIYCPNSKSAVESSKLIRDLFFSSGVRFREFIRTDSLFTDEFYDYDTAWIKSELINTTATTIIIVGHIELVRWFPKELGKPKNYARAGEGIFIGDDDVEDILRDEA